MVPSEPEPIPWNLGPPTSSSDSPSTSSIPSTLTQLKYVLFSWPNNQLTKKDPIAQEFFKSKAQMSNFVEESLGGFPIELWQGRIAGDKPIELFLSGEQCQVFRDGFSEKMGPTRANQTWKREAVHHGSEVKELVKLRFEDQAVIEEKFAQLKDENDRYETRNHFEALLRSQEIITAVQGMKGEARFCAIDFETYEWNHDYITEVGFAKSTWRKGKFEKMDTRHFVVKENAHRRNGKFCPDARDHFHFGASETLSTKALVELLSKELLSPSLPIFLIFHDTRSDLKSLQLLGVSTSTYLNRSSLPHPDYEPGYKSAGRYILDTQTLYSGFNRRKKQTKLGDAVQQFGISLSESKGEGGYVNGGDLRSFEDDELKFHNSGNDAWATLQVFWKLMGVELQRGD
ncbi:uncharacterized protein JCM6883_002564 [Sporobolomyces salmoneus]|uniref:uncharacterized protein n=1 Tax=Sporobolomyces salmoneus TaxID=183962 RepID=UPI003178D401